MFWLDNEKNREKKNFMALSMLIIICFISALRSTHLIVGNRPISPSPYIGVSNQMFSQRLIILDSINKPQLSKPKFADNFPSSANLVDYFLQIL
ncbi:MAG: hypothetical protein CVT97_09245 [Bacteroidetes bacterium HGW-Bacteroidetes-14]|nr:MAG: hypothetical protein CVT97_09245 [Bacteroidetes bacterium HGW-Bacteroidetes-14]